MRPPPGLPAAAESHRPKPQATVAVEDPDLIIAVVLLSLTAIGGAVGILGWWMEKRTRHD